VYAPGLQIINEHELPGVKTALFSNLDELENIKTSVDTSQRKFDLDTLLRMHNISRPSKEAPHWSIIATASSSALVLISVLYIVIKMKRKIFALCCLRTGGTQQTPIPFPGPELTTVAASTEQTDHSVSYTYATPNPR
jgi:hypothetical protein